MKNYLIDNKIFTVYLEEIYRKLNEMILAKPGYEYRLCKTNNKSIHEQIGDLENESHDAQLLSFSQF